MGVPSGTRKFCDAKYATNVGSGRQDDLDVAPPAPRRGGAHRERCAHVLVPGEGRRVQLLEGHGPSLSLLVRQDVRSVEAGQPFGVVAQLVRALDVGEINELAVAKHVPGRGDRDRSVVQARSGVPPGPMIARVAYLEVVATGQALVQR